MPLPVKLIVCTPVPALSLIVIVPLLVPVAVGVKVTEMEQDAPAAMVPLLLPAGMQVFVCANSALPLLIADIFKLALPVLLRVTFLAGLVVPTAWEAKLKVVGDRLTTGPTPVPVT